MTEEDARKTIAVAGKEAIHLAVTVGKETHKLSNALGQKAYAATIGRGLTKFQNRTRWSYNGSRVSVDLLCLYLFY